MATEFDLIDPPELVDIEHHPIEDFQGRSLSHPFAHFRWHDADYWLLGQIRWHNMMSVGKVFLRLPLGKKAYPASLTVHPRTEPPTLTIGFPRTRFGTLKRPAFVFVGFEKQKVVNIHFIREEHCRIDAMPYGKSREKMVRPASGLVI